MKVTLYTQSGEKSGTLELPAEIFEVAFNKDLVHQALVRQLANRRISTAQVKNRSAVRGGGKKPFRQKGTGRARQGTIRAPQMRGGGVVFGPSTDRNFKKDMPKKQRRKALFSALSLKAKNDEIIALEGYTADTPKTKDFVNLMSKMNVERKLLVVIAEKNEIIEKSINNIPNVKTILAPYVNIWDLQRHGKVLLLKDAVDKLKETFLTQSK